MANTRKRRPRHTPPAEPVNDTGRCRECGKQVEPREGFVCDKCYSEAVFWHIQDYDDD